MTAAAMLQFEMRRGDLPAVVLAADQAECGHPHIFKENSVLMAVFAAATTASEQLHRLDGDAG